MTLRTVHLGFILFAMVVMDLFGFWGVYFYATSHERAYLVLGIVGLLASLALAAYGLFATREFDREHLPG